jgi:transcriptional regulator with XRE-family HTH domain
MDKESFNTNLGDALREIRQEKGLSQEKMAERAGLARNYVGEVERGEKSITVYALFMLLESNGISISKFLERV